MNSAHLAPDQRQKMGACWRVANYLSVEQQHLPEVRDWKWGQKEAT